MLQRQLLLQRAHQQRQSEDRQASQQHLQQQSHRLHQFEQLRQQQHRDLQRIHQEQELERQLRLRQQEQERKEQVLQRLREQQRGVHEQVQQLEQQLEKERRKQQQQQQQQQLEEEEQQAGQQAPIVNKMKLVAMRARGAIAKKKAADAELAARRQAYARSSSSSSSSTRVPLVATADGDGEHQNPSISSPDISGPVPETSVPTMVAEADRVRAGHNNNKRSAPGPGPGPATHASSASSSSSSSSGTQQPNTNAHDQTNGKKKVKRVKRIAAKAKLAKRKASSSGISSSTASSSSTSLLLSRASSSSFSSDTGAAQIPVIFRVGHEKYTVGCVDPKTVFLTRGTRIVANYQNAGHWYPGCVTRVHMLKNNGRARTLPVMRYDVLYDDGYMEQQMPRAQLQIYIRRGDTPPPGPIIFETAPEAVASGHMNSSSSSSSSSSNNNDNSTTLLRRRTSSNSNMERLLKLEEEKQEALDFAARITADPGTFFPDRKIRLATDPSMSDVEGEKMKAIQLGHSPWLKRDVKMVDEDAMTGCDSVRAIIAYDHFMLESGATEYKNDSIHSEEEAMRGVALGTMYRYTRGRCLQALRLCTAGTVGYFRRLYCYRTLAFLTADVTLWLRVVRRIPIRSRKYGQPSYGERVQQLLGNRTAHSSVDGEKTAGASSSSSSSSSTGSSGTASEPGTLGDFAIDNLLLSANEAKSQRYLKNWKDEYVEYMWRNKFYCLAVTPEAKTKLNRVLRGIKNVRQYETTPIPDVFPSLTPPAKQNPERCAWCNRQQAQELLCPSTTFPEALVCSRCDDRVCACGVAHEGGWEHGNGCCAPICFVSSKSVNENATLLVCCDNCSNTFHVGCVGLKEPPKAEEPFICPGGKCVDVYVATGRGKKRKRRSISSEAAVSGSEEPREHGAGSGGNNNDVNTSGEVVVTSSSSSSGDIGTSATTTTVESIVTTGDGSSAGVVSQSSSTVWSGDNAGDVLPVDDDYFDVAV